MRIPRLRFGPVLVLGLVVRLLLAPIGAHPFDTAVFFDTAQRALEGRPFYGTTQYSYPPTWAGILVLVDAAYRPLAAALGAAPLSAAQVFRTMHVTFVLGSPFLADWLFLLLMKLPLIAGDLGLALLLRRTAVRLLGEPNLGDRAFAWYFLNPYAIWISSVWGMFDVLPTFFALLAVLLFVDRRDLASGLAFGVAVSLKYFPVLAALALLVAYRGTLTRGRVARFGAGFVAFLAAISAPFLLTDAGAYVGGILSPASGSYLGRVSIWELLDKVGIVAFPVWLAAAVILVTVALVAFLASLWGRVPPLGAGPTLWIEACLIALTAFYAVNYAVNAQYFVWILPFLILDAVHRRERPWALIGVTALLFAYIVTNVQHYSFFLPLITINHGLAPFVPAMAYWPDVTFVLALLTWVLMLGLLMALVSRAGGWPVIHRAWSQLRRTLRLPWPGASPPASP